MKKRRINRIIRQEIKRQINERDRSDSGQSPEAISLIVSKYLRVRPSNVEILQRGTRGSGELRIDVGVSYNGVLSVDALQNETGFEIAGIAQRGANELRLIMYTDISSLKGTYAKVRM